MWRDDELVHPLRDRHLQGAADDGADEDDGEAQKNDAAEKKKAEEEDEEEEVLEEDEDGNRKQKNKSKTKQERRASSSSSLIVWMNDLEKDDKYKMWPASFSQVFGAPGGWPNQLRYVARNAITGIAVVDPSRSEGLRFLLTARMFVQGNAPIRIGVIFRTEPATAARADKKKKQQSSNNTTTSSSSSKAAADRDDDERQYMEHLVENDDDDNDGHSQSSASTSSDSASSSAGGGGLGGGKQELSMSEKVVRVFAYVREQLGAEKAFDVLAYLAGKLDKALERVRYLLCCVDKSLFFFVHSHARARVRAWGGACRSAICPSTSAIHSLASGPLFFAHFPFG